jgi:hypothetical protein
MAKGLALARAIGLKWPVAADEPEIEAETTVEEAVPTEIIGAEPAQPGPDAPSAAMIDALSQALLDSPAQGTAVAAGELRESVTNDAITAIEADIASLLSSMTAVGDVSAVDADSAVDAEDTTLALLGELDRLWQADPLVGNADAAA